MNKTILTLFIILIFNIMSYSQIRVPDASPVSKIQQTVGLTDINIEYNRPSVKGRKIFGELVPFGEIWRTGANTNTVISFGDDVVIGGKTLPKGSYAIYTKPNTESWEVYFYSDTNNWGLPQKWDETKIVLKTTVKPITISNHVETLNIGINSLDLDFGFIDILWENTLVSVKFEVPTSKIANESIDKIFSAPVSDANTLYLAANYYYQSGSDTKKALSWINKAIEILGDKTPAWYTHLKSQLETKK